MTLQSVLATLCLFVYIFAVIAPEIFYIDDIEYKIRTFYSKDKVELAYYYIGAYGNFRSFNMTLYAIFQQLTQSSWHFLPLYEGLLQ